ncbi:MAG: hypothetical protein ACRDY2_07095 [Acidimicrobiales bacterium]
MGSRLGGHEAGEEPGAGLNAKQPNETQAQADACSDLETLIVAQKEQWLGTLEQAFAHHRWQGFILEAENLDAATCCRIHRFRCIATEIARQVCN